MLPVRPAALVSIGLLALAFGASPIFGDAGDEPNLEDAISAGRRNLILLSRPGVVALAAG